MIRYVVELSFSLFEEAIVQSYNSEKPEKLYKTKLRYAKTQSLYSGVTFDSGVRRSRGKRNSDDAGPDAQPCYAVVDCSIRAGFSLQRITTKAITIVDDHDEIDHRAGEEFKWILPHQPIM